MPELPEVETIKNDLSTRIIDKKIVGIEIRTEKIIRGEVRTFRKELLNHEFRDIRRRGKLLIAGIGNDRYLTVHLRMTGQLIYGKDGVLIAGGHEQKNQSDSQIGKHTHVILKFADNSILYYNDIRKFGYLRIVSGAELEVEMNKFGPEPLEKEFNRIYLKGIMRGNKRAIKTFLLDQANIAGIGNIYADEALFGAGVLPERSAAELNEEEIGRLVMNIKRIIKEAVRYRGTTFSDYRDPSGVVGNYSKMLKVYGRGGQKCLACGEILIKVKVNGRGTVYCARCQK